ncbi:MAG: HEPN domain-containing protein [Deltaproteobacteria bacterium]|nr:HEPN domain-containing protein [Deltaproteobacteria bacterium]
MDYCILISIYGEPPLLLLAPFGLLPTLVVKAMKEHAPYTHSLTFLASKTGIEIQESILDRLAEYTEFHLESRYPDEKKDFYRSCTEEFAKKKFAEIEEVYQWLIQK